MQPRLRCFFLYSWSKLRHALVLCLILGLSGFQSFAQHFNGVVQSSYMPLEQIHLNPAKITDSRMFYDVNILGVSALYNNNFFLSGNVFGVLFKSGQFQRFSLAKDQKPIVTGLLRVNQKSRGFFSDVPLGVDFLGSVLYRGPAFMYNLGKDFKRKHSIAVFLNAHTISSISGINRNYLELYNRYALGLDDQSFVGRLNNLRFRFNGGMNYGTNVYNEIGITYASELYKTKQHVLSAGLSLKRYNGIYFSGLRAKNLFFRYDGPPVTTNNQHNLYVEAENYQYVNSNPNTNNNYTNPIRMFDYSKLISGNGGWGIDLGISYMYIADTTKQTTVKDTVNGTCQEVRCENRYLLKAGISVTDLGYMNYKTDLNYTANTKTTIKDWDKFIADPMLYQTLITKQPNQPGSITVIAPTMLHVDFDFHFPTEMPILRNLYLNMGYNHDLSFLIASRGKSFITPLWNYFSISTRYENPDWEIDLPITSYVSNVPQKPFARIGLAGRYKNVFLGTTDLASVVGISSMGAGVYAGVKYGVAYACPKPFEDSLRILDSVRMVPDSLRDRDHDGVPDVKDKCIDSPGVASNFGCPINQDSLFEAVLFKIPRDLFIYNTAIIKEPKKPQLDTLAEVLVANPRFRVLVSGEADTCLQGPKAMDSLAELRTKVLLDYMQKNRVPLKQMIGVAMRHEQPLHIILPFRQYVLGKDDERDGILDNIDRCPTVPGLITEEGCPKTDVSNEESFASSLGERVEFWKGLGSFAYSSQGNLDEVANIMKRNKKLKCLIRTFVGREIKNRMAKEILAQQRADTIKAYMVKLGVDSTRLIALGMSSYEPLGSVPTISYIQGIEDRDRDKISDTVDRCPTLKGTIENYGCPTQEIGDIYLKVDSLSNEIKFLPDRPELDISSGKPLVQIIDILRANKNVKLLISGIVKVSNLSNRQKNKLANMRAEVLQNYLIGFGVSPKRIDAIGMGWQQPTSVISQMRILESHLTDGEGDGIKDYEDKCPTLEGTAANQGCPQMVYEEGEELLELEKKIVWKNNSYKVEDSVYKYLDQLIQFLKRNPTTHLLVYGNLFNSKLSKEKQDIINIKRAEFLRNYILKKIKEKRGNRNPCEVIHESKVSDVGVSYLEKTPWLVPNLIGIDPAQDYDGDGVKDIYDRCPRTQGSSYNFGCPYDVQKITRTMEGFAKKIFFDINKYNLLPPSIKVLDKLAKMMLDDESLRFVISGNADNTGNQKINQPLSLNRAISVQKYLIKQGIKADRLLPIGLSDQFPIGDNKTIDGRQQNRSVRFQLLE